MWLAAAAPAWPSAVFDSPKLAVVGSILVSPSLAIVGYLMAAVERAGSASGLSWPLVPFLISRIHV